MSVMIAAAKRKATENSKARDKSGDSYFFALLRRYLRHSPSTARLNHFRACVATLKKATL
jgi:hypothetical protein